MKIGFDRRLGVGDIVTSIPALYMIKRLFPQAVLTLFTTKTGKMLCKNYDFIDKIITANKDGSEIEQINKRSFELDELFTQYAEDVLILGERTSKNIKIAKQSKCKKIITWRHLHSIFSKRFYHPKHIKRSQRLEILRCLDLTRMIEPKIYDKFMSENKFELKSLPVRLTTDKENLS